MASISSSLEKILLFKPYQYNYKLIVPTAVRDSFTVNSSKAYIETFSDTALHYGLMAQDVEQLFPNLVRKDENGMMSINYSEIIPLLIKAIQEQNVRIQQLEAALNINK